MNRRTFLRSVAAITGAIALPALPVTAAPSVFGLESLGFTESIVWHEKFQGWLVTLQNTVGGKQFLYERIMEDDPRKQIEQILDFYRDDAVRAFERMKNGQ